ncbi:hypothetical protein ACJJTC_013945 [Scirpophaga incertulas]
MPCQAVFMSAARIPSQPLAVLSLRLIISAFISSSFNKAIDCRVGGLDGQPDKKGRCATLEVAAAASLESDKQRESQSDVAVTACDRVGEARGYCRNGIVSNGRPA